MILKGDYDIIPLSFIRIVCKGEADFFADRKMNYFFNVVRRTAFIFLILFFKEMIFMTSTRLACRCCGSKDIITVVGFSNALIESKPERMVCARCGDTVEFKMPNTEDDISNAAFKLRIHIFGKGNRCTLSSTLDIPIEDGEHDLSKYDYPLSRYEKVEVNNLNVSFDGVWYPVDKLPITLHKSFTAESPFGDISKETHMITLSVEII